MRLEAHRRGRGHQLCRPPDSKLDDNWSDAIVGGRLPNASVLWCYSHSKLLVTGTDLGCQDQPLGVSMAARQKVVLGVAVALLVAIAGVGGWLLQRGSTGASEASDPGSSNVHTAAVTGGIEVGVPTIVTAAQLKQFASDHYPMYWAGNRPDTQIELTVTSKDAIFVRYLPKDAKAGGQRPYLTVATYGDIDGYTALTAAKKRVASVVQGQNGAVIAVFNSRPNSTYFSFKNAGFQVEVFSPKKGESKRLTDDGSIKLVGGTR